MHMADALVSPVVGGAMTAISTTAIGYSVKKIANDKLDEKKIPLMGIMGAFVFAGQMINFTIPGTGSSGHIGGGILLAALLGPFPALITISSVLLIQCLFFADGGLLSYGCNVFNLGVCTCLIAYQFIFKPIIKKGINRKSIITSSILSCVLGLQLGAFCVVLETMLSGITELPFGLFVLLVQPIHLAIGLVEGIVTAGVLCFIYNVRPEILDISANDKKIATGMQMKNLLVTFLVLTFLIGGVLSLFASSLPDGLEWSIQGVAGTTELEREGIVYNTMNDVINTTAFMPDYSFSGNEDAQLGTSIAGIVGSIITIIFAAGIGTIIRAVHKKNLVSVKTN